MKTMAIFLVVCLFAALAPLLAPHGAGFPSASSALSAPVEWPFEFEGIVLTRLPLTETETRFESDFPGRIARFTDGRREVIVRAIAAPTRKAHSLAECYRAEGWSTRPLASASDGDGRLWSRFEGSLGKERVVLRERFVDSGGNSWPDLSSWYWAASQGLSAGPWIAYGVEDPAL